MFCIRCGEPIREGLSRCSKCGAEAVGSEALPHGASPVEGTHLGIRSGWRKVRWFVGAGLVVGAVAATVLVVVSLKVSHSGWPMLGGSARGTHATSARLGDTSGKVI